MTETKLVVETQVEPRDCRDRARHRCWMAGLQRQATEVKPGHRRTGAKAERPRIKAELKGRRSPMESKGWRDKAKLKPWCRQSDDRPMWSQRDEEAW